MLSLAGSMSRRFEYAYSFQRGLLVAHGRSDVDVFISATEQSDTFWQFAMLIACVRSMVEPSRRLRWPLGAPSTNADWVEPSSSLFQSGTVRMSSIARSTAASAA